MKRNIAINRALRVAARLRSCNGIVGTPEADHTAFRIKRLWLFGSTAKGKENPNDVDLLFEGAECGQWQRSNLKNGGRRAKPDMDDNRRYGAKTDKDYKRRHGLCLPIRSRQQALRYLRGHEKMVRFHDIRIDGDLAFPRVLLYPRNDLTRSQDGQPGKEHGLPA